VSAGLRTRRGRYVSVSERVNFDVEIDITQYFDQVSTEILCEELTRRRKAGECVQEDVWSPGDVVEQIERAFDARDAMHFRVLMCRLRAMVGAPA